MVGVAVPYRIGATGSFEGCTLSSITRENTLYVYETERDDDAEKGHFYCKIEAMERSGERLAC